MEEVKTFIVLEDDEDTRLDAFLAQEIQSRSRTYIQALIKDKKVTVNEKIEKASYKVSEEDIVEISIPEPKELNIEPENIDVEIVYEDSELAVIYKPRGMVVHPAPGNYTGTLVNALLYHMKGNLSSINGIIRPGIVHRIDKDTSGLLLIAKTDNAHRHLSHQLKNHSIKRVYFLICHNEVKEDEFTVDAPIGRNPKDRLKMAVVVSGKNAVTHFKVLSRGEGYTYLQATLETGRTHQIRVHMAYKGYPLLGDPLYGPKNPKIKIDGQLLHAGVIGFVHPFTNEFMEFSNEPPQVFKEALRKLSLD
ncbi:23S rRNA pseudouridine1911/1915/1917 synthase [Acetoanaerobium pronyense]|uniref:Pseudouridine synthase n=1 Tax=Acetoanaerobium pronyense TaxID=1482736 RepID=A0ABS4KHB2_9FIRM|nr:RluA family pseudouridine synthase [Acetoanaerobium pronyense]MBP2026646.1 23S rRNA pseudouridine1911/1915/1917 synthase [Acetoanaerobium pronyense]